MKGTIRIFLGLFLMFGAVGCEDIRLTIIIGIIGGLIGYSGALAFNRR
jgi:hypothetical protein